MPYPATIGLFGQFSTSPTPRTIPLLWAWGVHLNFQGLLAPLAITRPFGPTPLIMESKASTAHGGHKPQVGPPEPILAPKLNGPKNGQKDPRFKIGREPPSATFQPLASGDHQRPPAQIQQDLPPIQRKDSPSPMYSIPRIQAWCIYGIIYNYAPILLSNPMSMLSRPNYYFSNKVPKYITHFQSNSFQSFSLAICGSYQKTIKVPQPPGPAAVGLNFLFRIIPIVISRGYQSFNQFSRNQVLWYSLENSIGPYRLYSRNLYGLGPFGPIHSQSSILKMARSVWTQNS
ncbi:hypothetical protein O181_102401 [Austropuccinia psidii MF-1]|uniref:Uncharacterized protein n=1 Tax=Austropuccinia psidii MF-1 TaxID=1389203 RepID=A0A9Q3PJJ0_9BASI|nr:hypothetical protein [Austropuccinia psidii MF-1]